MVLADAVHRVGDPHEVLEEVEGVLLVLRVVLGQDEGHLDHVLAVEGHPGGAVGLLQRAAGGERRAAVEDADVVEAQEPAGEDVAPLRVLAVHPPVEVEHQAVERALQELDVLAPEVALHLVEEEGGPGVDGRVHVAEVPLVGRDLPVRVGVEAAQHQQELLLGEVEVDERERDRVERQVPGGVPGVLPLVGHGDDVAVEHVEPLGVPHLPLRRPDERMRLVLLEPGVHVEEVVLLRPEHPGQRLPVDPPLVLAQRGGRDPLVELVGVGQARGERRVEALAERLGRAAVGGDKPQADDRRAAGGHVEDVAGRGLRAGLRRVDGLAVPGDDVLVERILDPGRSVRLAPEALGVALVLGEEELRRAVTVERVVAQLRVRGADRSLSLAQARLRRSLLSTTRCCGTRASGAGGAGRLPARGCGR